MIWSPYSEALFDIWLSRADNNILVSACPGSGKTTNIKYLCTDIISPTDETLYLAFNRAIVDEAKAKLPQHINIMTLNGLGHRAVMAEYGRVTVDKDKVFSIIRKECKQGRLETRNEYNDRVGEVNKAVALLKINLNVSADDFSSMCNTFDIDEYDEMYGDCERVLNISDTDTKVIDFNDQLRFPVIYDLHMPSYDNVLVDESQDLNPLQATMVSKLHARYCFVGDPHQAIYGFRGAMSNSMQYLKEKFDCLKLPLKLSYRCPQSVVEEAARLFDDIEALPDAPIGQVTCQVRGVTPQYRPHDLILCRYNAPIIAHAYALLRRGVGCRVRGRDIGTGLVKLVDRLAPSSNVTVLTNMLSTWRHAQIEKAGGDTAKEQRVNDKADSLLVIMDGCRPVDSVNVVKERIARLFDASTGVMLSTVHKAKGLEAESVYILDHHLMPSKYAARAWQKEQERNIQYVAVTRARSQLVYM